MAHRTKGKFDTAAMILAFIAMGGFLYWLSVASEPTTFAIAEEGEQAQTVTLAQLVENPAGFQDELVEVAGLQVRELLGSHVFLAGVNDTDTYLVRLAPALIADGFQVLPGDQGSARGTVHMMSDSVLEVWDREALFVDAQQRETAAGAPSYLLVREMQLSEPAETEDPQDQETGQD